MEEYLKNVLEQVRCKKAHGCIEQELRDHLEDQISDNISCGMDEKKAVEEAVKDMGDPIETGIMLDKIHRPRMAWKMILLVGIISVLGVVIHFLISQRLNTDPSGYGALVSSSMSYINYVSVGFLIMIALYWLDYTFIARYARLITCAFILMAVLTLLFGLRVNGAAYWLRIGGTAISVKSLMLLYVPIYGGVLYKYYGKGYKGVLSAVVWMLVPVLLVLRMPSLATAALMLTSMLVMLTIAVMKGWFKVRKKITIASLWGIFGVLPVTGSAVCYFGNVFQTYQRVRIEAFLDNRGETNYLTGTVRDVLSNMKFIGDGGTDVVGRIEDINSDYLLTYLSSSCGLLAGIAICCVLAAIVFYVFWIAKKQKNQLGMIMGFGCGMVFIVSLLVNILVNIGAVPPVSTSLPFLSAGGGNIITSYALIGIVLSVYRFKNVYPRHVNIDSKKRRNIDISNG